MTRVKQDFNVQRKSWGNLICSKMSTGVEWHTKINTPKETGKTKFTARYETKFNENWTKRLSSSPEDFKGWEDYKKREVILPLLLVKMNKGQKLCKKRWPLKIIILERESRKFHKKTEKHMTNIFTSFR